MPDTTARLRRGEVDCARPKDIRPDGRAHDRRPVFPRTLTISFSVIAETRCERNARWDRTFAF
jgi:hypothetical protein